MKRNSFLFIAFIAILFIGLSCKSYLPSAIIQSSISENGMVSVAHPLAMQAGKMMLEKGGNAADAAVAAAFTLAVVEPSMSGLGGRLQAIVYLPTGEVVGVDATTQAPFDYDFESAPKGRYGYPVIGIPGVVAGLMKLHSEYGSLPLAQIMAPSIHWARSGFRILPGEALRHSLAKEQIIEFSGTSEYFTKKGETYKAGDKWVQKDLAKTLKAIAIGGRAAFYEGEIARKIVADHQANGGLLKMDDLRRYEAKSSKVVSGEYRGYDIHGLWLPSFGAITIEIMQILEQFDVKSMSDAEWASVMNQAIELAYEDRKTQYESEDMSTWLTSKEHAIRQAQQIHIDRHQRKMGEAIQLPENWLAEMGHTTHLSTADEEGMMVALTQSLGPNMGSKVVTPGLGFVYAVTLGEYLGVTKPGHRASSHISPMVITKNSLPVMGLGAAGGSRIISAITSVISRVVDKEMSLDQALAAPRVHPVGDTIWVETHPGGWNAKAISKLQAYGFPTKRIDQPGRFGRVHAVLFDRKMRKWVGAADPDWEGAVGGPLRVKK